MVVGASLRGSYASPMPQGRLEFFIVAELEDKFRLVIENSNRQTFDGDHPNGPPIKIAECPQAIHQEES
jgi:hypothetical protein